MPVEDFNKNQLLSLLDSGCEVNSIHRFSIAGTEMFLQNKPSVGLLHQIILLNRSNIDFIETRDAFMNKISLSMKCSPGIFF